MAEYQSGRQAPLTIAGRFRGLGECSKTEQPCLVKEITLLESFKSFIFFGGDQIYTRIDFNGRRVISRSFLGHGCAPGNDMFDVRLSKAGTTRLISAEGSFKGLKRI